MIFGRRFPFMKAPSRALPTVKLDASRVTQAVRDEVEAAVRALPDIGPDHFNAVCDAALESISRGRDLALLCRALLALQLPGMTKARAADIARSINNSATALVTRARQRDAGIKEAKWLYSGAPCILNVRNATEAERRQDAAHKAASGKIFQVEQGMFLDGKWTYPGSESGCKCVSIPVIPGFE